jgi:hypothetical protein
MHACWLQQKDPFSFDWYYFVIVLLCFRPNLLFELTHTYTHTRTLSLSVSTRHVSRFSSRFNELRVICSLWWKYFTKKYNIFSFFKFDYVLILFLASMFVLLISCRDLFPFLSIKSPPMISG